MSAEYIAAGYYLALRERTLSASGCLSRFFPDEWAIGWTSKKVVERRRAAAAFGIARARLPEVTGWAAASFSRTFGWPNVFYTPEGARQAHAALLPADVDIVLFGLGLHSSNVARFLAAQPPPGAPPVAQTGIFECVKAGRPIAEGGEPAGFELLAIDAGLLTCSWLCSRLDRECADRLGVRINSRGLAATHAGAQRSAEYISREDVAAEPGLWLPWLLTIYPAR